MPRYPAAFENVDDDYDAILNSFVNDRFELSFEDAGLAVAAISRIPKEGLREDDAALLHPIGWFVKDVVQIEVSAPCESEMTITSSDPKEKLAFTPEDIAALAAQSAAHTFAKLVYDLFFAANIARPGASCIVGGVILGPHGIEHKFKGELADPFMMAADTASRLGWPNVKRLLVADVWNWLQMQAGFRDAFGGGPTGRALNSLAHILAGVDDRGIALMWSMIGLEAIYTSGNSGLVQQLRERVQLFLGQGVRSAKLISSMYDLRSRFVHGDLDFAGPHLLYDADPRVERSWDELDDAVDVALALLLTTIQELVTRNWVAVRFTTVCASG